MLFVMYSIVRVECAVKCFVRVSSRLCKNKLYELYHKYKGNIYSESNRKCRVNIDVQHYRVTF